MWTMIKDAANWEQYKRDFCASVRVQGTLVDFSGTPADYPCLAASMSVPSENLRFKVVTAFVYVPNAAALLEATGQRVTGPDVGKPTLPSQASFNRWQGAGHMALISLLIEKGVITEQDYETRLLEAIEAYDYFRRDQLNDAVKKLTEFEKRQLAGLRPPGL